MCLIITSENWDISFQLRVSIFDTQKNNQNTVWNHGLFMWTSFFRGVKWSSVFSRPCFMFFPLLSSGRTLLDRLCIHPGDGSTEEEAKELCHRMLAQGLLHPFSDSSAELHGDSTVSAGFSVRPSSLLSRLFYKKSWHELPRIEGQALRRFFFTMQLNYRVCGIS